MNSTRKSRFLLTTAVLLAGISLASAQGMREGGGMGAGGGMGGGAAERGKSGGETKQGPSGASRGGGEGMMQGRAAEPRGGGRAESPAARPSRAERGGSAARSEGMTQGRAAEPRGGGRAESPAARPSRAERGAGMRESGRAVQREQPQRGQTIGQDRRDQKGQTIGRGRGEREQTRQSEQKAQGKQKPATAETTQQRRDQKTGAATQSPSAKPGTTTGANTRPSAPEGQAKQQGQGTATQSASGRFTVSAQQQTTLQRSVLSSRNVARVNVNSVNFRINTGVVVPRTVTFVSVAAFPVLIDYFPAYRDYSFFVVEDEIVFVDRRRRIVDVVPVGPRARFAGGGRVRGGSVAVLDLSPEEIRIVQRVLIERGLLIGEADGVLGVRTRQALNVFQRRQGFQATGTIDTRTVAALGVSNKISASQGQSTTVGQGQGGQQPAAQQNRQAPAGQAGRQQPSAATTGQAGRQQPSSETKAGKQEPSGQTTGQAPAKGNKQPSARQPSGQTYAPSKGGQSDQGGSGRKY